MFLLKIVLGTCSRLLVRTFELILGYTEVSACNPYHALQYWMWPHIYPFLNYIVRRDCQRKKRIGLRDGGADVLVEEEPGMEEIEVEENLIKGLKDIENRARKNDVELENK